MAIRSAATPSTARTSAKPKHAKAADSEPTASRIPPNAAIAASPRNAARIQNSNLDAGVTEKVIRALLASEKKGGIPYWGPGDLRVDTMNNMIRAQKLVGAVKGDVDWSKLIDESFLPDDLKSKKK